jgi:hypothetical protein
MASTLYRRTKECNPDPRSLVFRRGIDVKLVSADDNF